MNINNLNLQELVGKPIGMDYDLYLTQDEIGEGFEYNNFLTFCSQLSENDVVNLTISCGGGRCSTASLITTAIENSRATFVAHLNAQCWSASTFIALSCDIFTVSDFVEFGCHSVQSGTGFTELSKMKSRTDAVERLNALLIQKYYSLFLLPEEIVRLNDGAEITFFKDELVGRLQEYASKRQKLTEEQETNFSEFSDEEINQELLAIEQDKKDLRKELKNRSQANK